MWQAVVTDLAGTARSFVENYDVVTITTALNGYREATVSVDPYDGASADLLVAERALKLYDSAGALRFNGKIWEPLERNQDRIKAVARGPFAEFSWRRVRAATSYTATNNAGGPWDAGQILADRIAVQNGYRSTYLRMGARQASLNRVRSYEPGQREDEVAKELVGAAGGFFFLEDPLDAVPGFMAELRVLYPAAGVSREDVRFEYGVGTADNCSGYTHVQTLPLDRFVASSSAAAGGRIAAAAEDAAAIARFGLFEDEAGWSDVSDAALLSQQAQGSLRLTPPTTIAMQPTLEAPVLFRDFNVGDFVRCYVLHGSFSFFGWARVAAATLAVDAEGTEQTSALTLELPVGGAPLVDPELLFAADLEETRRRLEALERKVQDINATELASPSPPTPGGSSGDPTYTPPAEPGTGGPAPPDAPGGAPLIPGLGAFGQWLIGSSPEGVFSASVDGNGLPTSVYFEVVGRGSTAAQAVGSGPASVGASFGGLARNTGYTVVCHASNAAGETTSSAAFSTPNAQFG